MGDVIFEDEKTRQEELDQRSGEKKPAINVFIFSSTSVLRGADIFLLIIILISLSASVYFFFFAGSDTFPIPYNDAEIERLTIIPRDIDD